MVGTLVYLNNAVRGGGNTWPEISTLLGDRSSDSRTFHLSLWVDDDSSVVLEVDPSSFLPPESFPLSNHDGWVDLLSQVRVSLLDSGHDHVSTASTRKTVQTGTPSLNSDDVNVLSSSVISTVDEGTYWETQGDSELVTTGTTTSSSLGHVVSARFSLLLRRRNAC